MSPKCEWPSAVSRTILAPFFYLSVSYKTFFAYYTSLPLMAIKPSSMSVVIYSELLVSSHHQRVDTGGKQREALPPINLTLLLIDTKAFSDAFFRSSLTYIHNACYAYMQTGCWRRGQEGPNPPPFDKGYEMPGAIKVLKTVSLLNYANPPRV